MRQRGKARPNGFLATAICAKEGSWLSADRRAL